MRLDYKRVDIYQIPNIAYYTLRVARLDAERETRLG